MSTNPEIKVTDEHIKLFKSLKCLEGYKDELDYEGLTLHRALVKLRKEHSHRLNPEEAFKIFLFFPIVVYFVDFNDFTGSSFIDIFLFIYMGFAPLLSFSIYRQYYKRRKIIDNLEKDNIPYSVVNNTLIPEALYNLIFRLKNFDEVHSGTDLSPVVKKELRKMIIKDYLIYLSVPILAILKTFFVESYSSFSITHWLMLAFSILFTIFFTYLCITRFRLINSPVIH